MSSDGAPGLELYRHIVDVLLAEHETSEPPQPEDGYPLKQFACVWGLYCRTHRFARAAVTLSDNDMGQEATPIVRMMLEHTIVVHWIIDRGDDGVDAIIANQSKQMKSWLRNTADTTLVVPTDISNELTDSFVGIDESKATRTFKEICKQISADELYAVYGFQSNFVHPTITTSNAYCDSLGKATLKPGGNGHPANMALIAHCLIWVGRAFDRITPEHPRADGLEKLAHSVSARPILPPYCPLPPPQASRSRGRRRRGR
jgi:hypothetical protein